MTRINKLNQTQNIGTSKYIKWLSFLRRFYDQLVFLLRMSMEKNCRRHEASMVKMRENHNVIVFKELIMAGDVELNPGPYPQGTFTSCVN